MRSKVISDGVLALDYGIKDDSVWWGNTRPLVIQVSILLLRKLHFAGLNSS